MLRYSNFSIDLSCMHFLEHEYFSIYISFINFGFQITAFSIITYTFPTAITCFGVKTSKITKLKLYILNFINLMSTLHQNLLHELSQSEITLNLNINFEWLKNRHVISVIYN